LRCAPCHQPRGHRQSK